MKQCLLIVTLGASLVLSACALFPRRDTVAYPAAGGPVPTPAGLYVDTVDVDRRVLATEVARDVKELIPVLAPGHGFAVVPSSQEGAWPVRVHVVERETIRDFSPQFAVMVSLEMFSSANALQPALTVVHTSESSDSITSPWVLKRILNDCLQEAAKGFAAKRGG